jgi:L-2-hydroxyglutarate oxidase
LEVTTSQGTLRATWLVNCAGLHSDRVARLSGGRSEARIVPFRGEYYVLRRRAEHLCRGLIYPVPDPRFPFLGVHLTRMIYGGVECGPNAVLALAREGYCWRDIDLRDLAETLGFRGFRRLALRYWRTGLAEMWRSVSRRAFCRSVQRLVPELTLEDLLPGSAGVRAQAVGLDGELVDDFRIEVAPRVVNVCNAPSPAATASLNVGRLVVERLAAAWT